MNGESGRIGLLGATGVGVGVGAIVAGGILALTGVAFASAGPAALVAFAANGAIAALTAVSFTRLARAFPESGGTYTYAKKVLSVEIAFSVGWVVWFASIVAAVLYALGFAAFATEAVARLLALAAVEAGWVRDSGPRLALALGATAVATAPLVRRAGGGGQWATIGKVIVFAALIAGGALAWLQAPDGTTAEAYDPFLPHGMQGLARAMGYTFIALQGFDLIAAVGGEVRNPGRNLPRAIYISLGLALAIYLPLLFLITTVGVPPEQPIEAAAAAKPEGLVAEAAERFLGPTGFWLVLVAGALRTPGTGRLLLLHIVPPPDSPDSPATASLRDAPESLAESLRASFERELAPETVVCVAADPWLEIARVARTRRCETLLLGLPQLLAEGAEARTEELMQRVPADVVVLRAPPRWRIRDAEQILVPLGGRRDHGHLRARLLASLTRWRPRTVTFVRIVPTSMPADALRRAEREALAIARDEASGPYQVEVVASDDPGGELARRIAACDLAVLGIRRPERRGRLFGELVLRIARETETPLLLISRRL